MDTPLRADRAAISSKATSTTRQLHNLSGSTKLSKQRKQVPMNHAAHRFNTIKCLAFVLPALLIYDVAFFYTARAFPEQPNIPKEQPDLVSPERIAHRQLEKVLGLHLPRSPRENYSDCLQRALETANSHISELHNQTPDCRNQVMIWAEDNCSRLIYAPSARTSSLGEALAVRLTDVAGAFRLLLAEVRRVVVRTGQLMKRGASLLRENKSIKARTYKTDTSKSTSDCVDCSLSGASKTAVYRRVDRDDHTIELEAAARKLENDITQAISQWFHCRTKYHINTQFPESTEEERNREQARMERAWNQAISSIDSFRPSLKSPSEMEPWINVLKEGPEFAPIVSRLRQLQKGVIPEEETVYDHDIPVPGFIIRCRLPKKCHIIDTQLVHDARNNEDLSNVEGPAAQRDGPVVVIFRKMVECIHDLVFNVAVVILLLQVALFGWNIFTGDLGIRTFVQHRISFKTTDGTPWNITINHVTVIAELSIIAYFEMVSYIMRSDDMPPPFSNDDDPAIMFLIGNLLITVGNFTVGFLFLHPERHSQADETYKSISVIRESLQLHKEPPRKPTSRIDSSYKKPALARPTPFATPTSQAITKDLEKQAVAHAEFKSDLSALRSAMRTERTAQDPPSISFSSNAINSTTTTSDDEDEDEDVDEDETSSLHSISLSSSTSSGSMIDLAASLIPPPPSHYTHSDMEEEWSEVEELSESDLI